MPAPTSGDVDTRVRIAIYDGMVRETAPPTSAALAAALGLEQGDVRAAFERLAEARALVLQPESREVLMAEPFSAVPTPFVVDADGRRYYANCIWDALGVAALLRTDARITTTCGCCGEAMPVAVSAGVLAPLDGVIHFAVPARRWWDDIVFS